MFRKDMEPSCAYCCYSRPIGQGDMICLKRGVVSVTESCRRFRYDPFKREPDPPQQLDTSKLKAEDFTL